MRSLLVGCFGAAAVGSTAALGPKRALLDSGAFTVNKFGLVDLSGFPMDARGVVDAGQTVQGSGLGIEVQENTTPSFGTYKLSPVAASALSDAITALVRFPAAACCLLLSQLGCAPVYWSDHPSVRRTSHCHVHVDRFPRARRTGYQRAGCTLRHRTAPACTSSPAKACQA